MYKIGNSIDIHPLVEGASLYLGGVLIPSKKGSISHSDGDALLHSICEAIIGALGKGDLGTIFPCNEVNKNRRSTEFLEECKKMLEEEQYNISNIDVMIVLEEPNLSKYKSKIAENIANILEIESDKINIKAGTNEKIGEIGNKESYLCWSSVLLEEIKK